MKTIQLPESLDLYQLINLIADTLCPIETDDAEGIGYQLTRIEVDKEITQAARDGLLPLRHPMTLAPVRFHPAAVMLAKDLTPYLAARNLAIAPSEPRLQSETVTVKDEAPSMKKSALIAELEHEWPTIEADLSEASRNGLNEARAPLHGQWYPDKARAWAKRQGKLREQVNKLSPGIFGGSSTIHRIR